MTSSQSIFSHYWQLIKPRPTLLALFSSMAGYVLGSDGGFEIRGFVLTSIAALLLGASANCFNQIIERKQDAKMKRTRERPIASGRMSVVHAAVFGAVSGIAAVMIFAFFVNALSAKLAMTLWVSYVLLYTPLKRMTPLCLYVGAVSGALPPCIGYVAATNRLEYDAWILFMILFVWQIPHFLVIAWLYREDYVAGGYRMPAANDPFAKHISLPIVVYIVLLMAVAFLPYTLHMVGELYAVVSICMGIAFLLSAIRFLQKVSRESAGKAITISVLYMMSLVTAMIVDKS